jgi:hypothetical protein
MSTLFAPVLLVLSNSAHPPFDTSLKNIRIAPHLCDLTPLLLKQVTGTHNHLLLVHIHILCPSLAHNCLACPKGRNGGFASARLSCAVERRALMAGAVA